MPEYKSQSQSLETQPEFSRRQLIYLSTLGVAGAGAIGTQILAPKPADAATVLGYVARFALSVGAAVVADYIGDYLKRRSRSSPKLTNVVQSANNAMIRGGFSDFSQSKVYETGGHFFYSAVNRDGFNTCVAFINNHPNDRRSNLSAMTEGPSVIGLALAADEVARNGSPQSARHIFHPEGVVSRSDGTFSSGYTRPDVFETEAGRVQVGYRNIGPGRGEVAVLAEKPLNRGKWSSLFERQYDVQYG